MSKTIKFQFITRGHLLYLLRLLLRPLLDGVGGRPQELRKILYLVKVNDDGLLYSGEDRHRSE